MVAATSSTTKRSSPRHVTALALAIGLIASGCTSNDTDGPASPDSTAPHAASGSATADPTTAAIAAMTKGAPVALTLSDLPNPPPGFSQQELQAFADRAIDITERGSSAEVATMTPTQAFDFVFDGQFEATKQAAADGSRAAAGTYDWEWAWASLSEMTPIQPARILDARWQVSTVPGKLADGTPSRQLQVVLSTAIEHFISRGPTKEGDDRADQAEQQVRPIVVKRSIIVRGFKPLGGAEWWPAIGVQTTPFFGGKCAPVNGSVLTPSDDPSVLQEDLKKLEAYLDDRDDIDAGASSNSTSMREYVDEYCED